MSIRSSRVATGVLVLVAVVMMANVGWAIRYALGPSKDEWKMKYDVQVLNAESNTLTVVFTLADEGRLKPLYSIDLVAFSKQLDSQGGRTYDLNVPIELKPAADGKRAGQAQMRKDLTDRAMIRLITLTVDGQRQPSGGAYYDIPIAKYVNQPPAGPSPLATPPASNVTR